MQFAVIGNQGMFGRDMSDFLSERGETVSGFNRSNLDLSGSVDSLAKVISGADVIVNCVAFTAVDAAEKQQAQANLVNGEYAGKIALVAKSIGARFAHLSTDYVFSGQSRVPAKVSTPLSPLNVYGTSKALGEELIEQSGVEFQIFRTAWLYGASGNCFPKSIAKKLLSGEVVGVVDDQVGQPTWTMDLARIVYAHTVNNYSENYVHAVSSGEATWFDFAKAVAKRLPDSGRYRVERINSFELKVEAARPPFSVLDNSETKGPVIGDWADRWEISAPEVLESLL